VIRGKTPSLLHFLVTTFESPELEGLNIIIKAVKIDKIISVRRASAKMLIELLPKKVTGFDSFFGFAIALTEALVGRGAEPIST